MKLLLLTSARSRESWVFSNEIGTQLIATGCSQVYVLGNSPTSAKLPDGIRIFSGESDSTSFDSCSPQLINDAFFAIGGEYDYVAFIDERVQFAIDDLLLLCNILELTEKHVVISPRLNRGPFLPLPIGSTCSIRQEDWPLVFGKAKELLPEYSYIPYASGACFIAKCSAIGNLGFLDTKYLSLDGAVADFCLRLNNYGFNALAANHIHVSIDGIDRGIPSEDRGRLVDKHPFASEAETAYLTVGIDPCDKFLDLMIPNLYDKPKLLFEFSTMFDHYCGTSEYQNALLEYFFELFSDEYDIHVHVNKEASTFFHLAEKYPNVHFVGELQGTYHLGFCANQPIDVDQECILNQHCLKTVYTILDIILSRTYYLKVGKWQRDDIMRLGMTTSDGLVAISDYSKNDCLAYFAGDPAIQKCSIETVSIASDFGKNVDTSAKFTLPFDEYYLIAGNFLRHKALRETVDALSESDAKFIVVGIPKTGFVSKNAYSYEGCMLSEAFLDYLYEHCQAVIFPSLYEGYGLPVAIGLKHGKRTIVNDNEVNHELYNRYPELQQYFIFFKAFSELPQIIDSVKHMRPLPANVYTYSWKDAVIGIEDYLKRVLAFQLDSEKLRHRWHMLNLMQLHIAETIQLTEESMGMKARLTRRFLDGHPGRYSAVKRAYHAYRGIVSGKQRKESGE